VRFRLDPRNLSEVDSDGHRAVRAGEYRIYVGGSSPETKATAGGISAKLTIAGSKDMPE
jgi:beta-glucosidase